MTAVLLTVVVASGAWNLYIAVIFSRMSDRVSALELTVKTMSKL